MSITRDTEDYIRRHASIKYCVKRGLVNYRALAKHISSETGKKVSTESMAIAARRFKDKISHAKGGEDILKLFSSTNIDIKNNIVVFTINKNVYPDALIDIERLIKKEQGMFFSIEGTKSITVIIQKQFARKFQKRFRRYVLEYKSGLSLITLTVKGIGDTPGAVFYLTGLFFENGINIEEFMSCYDDTLIVIKSENVAKVMEFLSF